MMLVTNPSATTPPDHASRVGIALADTPADGTTADELIREALRSIRLHLGMEVAFVSEFVLGQRAFRYVDSDDGQSPIKVGDSGPLEESYCQRVVDGRLPELIRDACRLPAAMALPVTAALPVGAHLSVPVRLADGRIYGTFCCFSRKPDGTLGDRDLAMMRVFADFAARQIERDIATQKAHDEAAERIRSVLEQDAFSLVYQPIYHFARDMIVGFESLSRFSLLPARTPDVWFREAAQVGLGAALETRVIERALQDLVHLPVDVYLSVNVSPDTVASGAIHEVLAGAPLERLVLEVTEHVSIDEYGDLASALRPLRERGLRLAVDDAGAGYASFRHILELEPDLIKLDITLTRDIDRNVKRRALAAALIRFAEETGARIISEGVETAAELDTLRQLGVNKAQGYMIGRPMPIAAAAALFRSGECEVPAGR